jgi:SAM-dependent methyltransferase
LFAFREYECYTATLSLGIRNARKNGLALGLKKTAGKITQPINSYTRFPEYFYLGDVIESYLQTSCQNSRAKILDVGSPKPFGLRLARSSNVHIEMTDVSPLNIDDYRLMWNALRPEAQGDARFSIQDARSLKYEPESFDIVYSMSVIEHVEGRDGDTDAAKELFRVLKPGGLLLFSVPYGNSYVEQSRKGLKGAVEQRGDNAFYFFQRIYDRRSLETRLLQPLGSLRNHRQWTVWRSKQRLLRQWANLGENIRGLLGFVNPWLSLCANRAASGLADAIPCSYGEIYSPDDIYGDVIVAGEKLS